MKICLMLFKICSDAKPRPLFPWPYQAICRHRWHWPTDDTVTDDTVTDDTVTDATGTVTDSVCLIDKSAQVESSMANGNESLCRYNLEIQKLIETNLEKPPSLFDGHVLLICHLVLKKLKHNIKNIPILILHSSSTPPLLP